MPLVNTPDFNTLSPTGQNILPPEPQAPPMPTGSPGGQGQPQQQPQDLQQAQPTQQFNHGLKYNPLDAAIPGQSLTDTPGNAPWEHPPQYTNPSEAADMVYKQLMRPTNLKQIILMLHKGIPAEALTRTILFSGFMDGKWTPDMAMLIAKPILAMLVGIGARAGIEKMKIAMPQPDKDKPVQMLAEAHAREAMNKPGKTAAERQEDLISGFLPRGRK